MTGTFVMAFSFANSRSQSISSGSIRFVAVLTQYQMQWIALLTSLLLTPSLMVSMISLRTWICASRPSSNPRVS